VKFIGAAFQYEREADYASLITAAHNQLHAPVIVIWDNLNTHVSAAMRSFIDAHPGWLTVVRLPAYAPDLNPTEGIWPDMKTARATSPPAPPATSPPSPRTGSKASSTGPSSSMSSLSRPGSPSSRHRHQTWPFSLCNGVAVGGSGRLCRVSGIVAGLAVSMLSPS
jgi:hypothetical protein